MDLKELLLVFTSVFITIFVSSQRKNLMKQYHPYILIIFDALITGCFMILAAFYFGDHIKLSKQFADFKPIHLLIIILISFLVTFNSILGLKILEKYKLGDLIITTTVVEILIAMAFDYIYYNEPFTFNKIISIPILIVGLYIFSSKHK